MDFINEILASNPEDLFAINEAARYTPNNTLLNLPILIEEDLTEFRSYGNGAYFKVYKTNSKKCIEVNRIYFTKAEFTSHKGTIPFAMNTKFRKLLNDILKIEITEIINGITITLPVYNMMLIQMDYAFYKDKMHNYDLNKILSIKYNPKIGVEPYFIPIDFPMPNYLNILPDKKTAKKI